MWPVTATKDYTKSQNLGQTYNGQPKYFSKSDEGKSTGIGYGFEDLTRRRLEETGHDVKQVRPYKNGPDYIVNGEPCQLKCSKYSYSTAKSYYHGENGEYSYGKQTAVVPKGQKKMADSVFNRQARNGKGRPVKVVESPVSRKEAENYTYKGVRSFMMDASDKRLVKPAASIGVVVFVAGAAYDLGKNWKHLDTKGKIIKSLKWLGIGSGAALLTLGCECGYRQSFRPRR